MGIRQKGLLTMEALDRKKFFESEEFRVTLKEVTKEIELVLLRDFPELKAHPYIIHSISQQCGFSVALERKLKEMENEIRI